MTLITVLAGAAILAVALMLVGMIRDARKVEQNPDYWRRKGVI